MAKNVEIDLKTQSALSTARYLQSILGDLAKMAQFAQLESTEAMLLAAKIEVSQAVRVLAAADPSRVPDYPRAFAGVKASRPEDGTA